MKHKRFARLLSMLLVVVTMFGVMSLPANAASLNDSGTVTIQQAGYGKYLTKSSGGTIGGGYWKYTSNNGLTGTAYCVNHGLKGVSPSKALTVQEYNREPKTMGAFANGYWQASGESIKTSVRVKTRISQLTEEGYYTGGIVPYGYRLENRGRTNKRNKEVCDLAIDLDEAEVVKVIFQKYVYEGYGSQRISRYLAEQGFRNRKGGNIPTTSINRIIKNPLYIGILCNGESRSENVLTELQIIDVDLFERAQKMIESRAKPRTAHKEIPLNTRGQSLLVGNVYCGHCGKRLTLATSGRKYQKKDGTVVNKTYARYQCSYNIQHPGGCDGPSGYGAAKLDDLVDQIIRIQFERIKTAPPQALIREQQSREVEIAKAKLNLLNGQYQQKQRDYQDLRAETLRVIRGDSRLNVDFLNSIVDETITQLKELGQQVKEAEAELRELVSGAEQVKEEYAQLMNWAELYDKCTFEAKKMIAAQFVKAVHVKRDYEIDVEFNVAFDEFQSIYLEPEKEDEKKRGASTLLALGENVGQAV